MPQRPQCVLILGAGINGCALARELVLSGVGVWLVDSGDIASGTTAYSSRLIHGGLRYLEYGEFDLVRESLGERTRLLRLAPQFVRPLQLCIPVENRWGGFSTAIRRFFKLKENHSPGQRGVNLVRLGLWFYDTVARDKTLPRHRVHRVKKGTANTSAGDSAKVAQDDKLPGVDATKYGWICTYYDAQVVYPERFVLSLVEDTARAAAENGTEFRLFTYHQATPESGFVSIRPSDNALASICECAPLLVVNATGAWVDRTLQSLGVNSKRLLGGTKGSHLFTRKPILLERLRGEAIYAEATDGRPFFILPLVDGVLIGTTDSPYDAPPETAVATQSELEYLINAVNEILPDVHLKAADVEMTYSGVRPLPFVSATTPGAVTRRHWMEPNHTWSVPLYSIVGGKLTTCRSLAEESAAMLLSELKLPVRATSRDRTLPGGESYPATPAELDAELRRLAADADLSVQSVAKMWSLVGTTLRSILAELRKRGEILHELIPGTNLPAAFVRWSIANEWVHALDDLVERRLMLLYEPRLSQGTLERLAWLLVEAGKLADSQVEEAVKRTTQRLKEHFAKLVQP